MGLRFINIINKYLMSDSEEEQEKVVIEIKPIIVDYCPRILFI